MVVKKEFYQNIFDNAVPLHRFLGMKLLDVRDGYAKAYIPFREEFIGDPRAQRIHGGIIATAMDAVGGAAAITTLTSFEDKISTVDIRVDYLRPAKTESLIVEGEIVRSGNRIVLTKMWACHENSNIVIAEGRAVFNVRRKDGE